MRKVAIVGAGMTPFGEHFALGIKDLLPMAFADCAASVDKGLAKFDLQAAWFGAMGTTDGFPSGILADRLGLPDLPVTRVENSCATAFRLYDCAPQSDGAAALVIAAEDVVDRFTDRPVWIRGVGVGLDSVIHQHKPDMTMMSATVRAGKQAFRMAGMTPSAVTILEGSTHG